MAEDRAADLLERLQTCGLATGVVGKDLVSNDVRPPYRKLCSDLGEAMVQAMQALAPGDRSDLLTCGEPSTSADAGMARLNAAAKEAKAAASQPGGQQAAKLDAALQALASAVGGGRTSDRITSLEHLVQLLQAARMVAVHFPPPPEAAASASASNNSSGSDAPAASAAAAPLRPALELTPKEVSTLSSALRAMGRTVQALGVGPDGGGGAGGGGREAGALVREALLPAAEAAVGQAPEGFFDPLIVEAELTAQQRSTLAEMHDVLGQEYALRRSVLIERAKVTLQAFTWSQRLADKGTLDEAKAAGHKSLAAMQPRPEVVLQDVYCTSAADLASLTCKATSGDVTGGLDASVKGVIIGKVPDRGGRAEGRAKEAYMPDFAPRRGPPAPNTGNRGGDAGAGAGGGGRGGGGGGGDRPGSSRGGGGGGVGGKHDAGQSSQKAPSKRPKASDNFATYGDAGADAGGGGGKKNEGVYL